jgi:hypothetical protein
VRDAERVSTGATFLCEAPYLSEGPLALHEERYEERHER